MEFNFCVTSNNMSGRRYYNEPAFNTETLFETMERKWNQYGYKMPKLIFWNVQARQNNIPITVKDGISFVSGMSPVLFEQILAGKTAESLMFDKLNSERYAIIQ